MNFAYLSEFMDSLVSVGIPGNAVCVTVDGKTAFEYSCGYEDGKKTKKFTPQSSVYMYSASKPVTVAAALQLVERGKMRLSDPLYDYIPEFRDVNIKNSDGTMSRPKNPITLYHLFTMTAGLTYNTSSENIKNALKMSENRADTLSVIRAVAGDGITFEPGTFWQYSLCHDVLAAVVEIVGGKRFCNYVKENIFDPCGMENSFYHPTEEQKNAMARQFSYKQGDETDLVALQKNGGNGEGTVVPTDNQNSLVFTENYDSGGAGIVSSVSDYVKFATALACDGKTADGYEILSSKTIYLMRQNTLTPSQLPSFNWSQHKGYGYGLGVRTRLDENGNTDLYGDFGWSGAAGATVLVNPYRRIGLAYAHHMLNPMEDYYLPRLCEALYKCLK